MFPELPSEKLSEMKYDLMDVIMVFVSNDKSVQKDELCGMLEVLLDDKTEKKDRLDILEKYYGIKRTVEFERRMGMCDYSIGIARKNFENGWNDGERIGVKQGIRQGIRQGIDKGQNMLVDTVNRSRNGESKDSILRSGVDEHTFELAMSIK